VVMTTHDLARGLASCDQVAILSRGKIAFQGRSEGLASADLAEIYQRAVRGLQVA